jgi:hypothetical protein
MAEQGTAGKVNAEKQAAQKARPAVEAASPAEAIALAPLIALSTAGGTLRPQSAWLTRDRFQGAQRVALATTIGRLHGNRHLQRVIASLQPRDGREREKTLSKRESRPHVPRNWTMPLPAGARRLAARDLVPVLASHGIGVMRIPEGGKGAPTEGGKVKSAEAPEAAKNFNLGLYDYNYDHMKAWDDTVSQFMGMWRRSIGMDKRPKNVSRSWYNALQKGGLLDKETAAGKEADVNTLAVDFAKKAQKESFKTWANDWGKTYSAKVYPVSDKSEIEPKLNERIDAQTPGKMDYLGLFGHGSSQGGWSHMGDVGKILEKEKIVKAMAPGFHLALYMCLTGAGGKASFASKLAGKLVAAGVSGPEVWAHTTAASAVYNPNWVVYKDLEEGGQFYQTVFSKEFVAKEESRLEGAHGGEDELLDKLKRALGMKYLTDTTQAMESWYQKTGGMASTQKYIMAAPMKHEESVTKLREEWAKYIDGKLAKVKSKKKK